LPYEKKRKIRFVEKRYLILFLLFFTTVSLFDDVKLTLNPSGVKPGSGPFYYGKAQKLC